MNLKKGYYKHNLLVYLRHCWFFCFCFWVNRAYLSHKVLKCGDPYVSLGNKHNPPNSSMSKSMAPDFIFFIIMFQKFCETTEQTWFSQSDKISVVMKAENHTFTTNFLVWVLPLRKLPSNSFPTTLKSKWCFELCVFLI